MWDTSFKKNLKKSKSLNLNHPNGILQVKSDKENIFAEMLKMSVPKNAH